MDDPFGTKLGLKVVLSLLAGVCVFAFIHTLLTA